MKPFAASCCSAAVALLCLFSIEKANADVTVFDSNQDYRGYMSVNGEMSVAQQFRLTDPSAPALSSVSLSIGNVSSEPSPNVILELRAQSLVEVDTNLGLTDNWPGASLAVLYNGPAPTANQLWVVPVIDSPLLTAGVSYWISLAVSGEGSIDWNYTYRDTGYIVDGGFMANAISDADSTLDVYYPQMMTVNAVPEPASWVLLGAGLFGAGFLRRFRIR